MGFTAAIRAERQRVLTTTLEQMIGERANRQRCLRRVGQQLLALTAAALALLALPVQAANGVEIRPADSSVPAAMSAGATAAVRIRVVNNGTTTWSAASLHRLGAQYTGAANQVTWSGFACGGYMNSAIDARAFLCGPVPPGGVQDIAFNITVPPGASGSVRLAVRMVQDGVQWFGASYSWSIALSANTLPDVVVDRVSVTPPNPAPGQRVSFNALVRNLGPVATPAGVPVGVAYLVDGAYQTWGSVNGPLAPGASVTIGTQGATWNAIAGNHTVTAVVDDVNRFAESNEDNNSNQAAFTVRSTAFPDVVVSSVALAPLNPVAGQAVSFTALVRNQGAASTPAGVSVGVAYFIDGAYRTWGSVSGPLAAGASVTVGTKGGTWIATPGDHQLTALVDDVNRFPEADETNNSTSSNFTVGSPSAAGNLYAINIDPANPAGNPTAGQLLALGARWVRIEWKADRGYSLYDPVIAAYRAAGLRVLLLVDYATVQPKPAFNAGDAAWQNYLPAFIAKVRELAGHYGDGVDAWEVWNEPDLFAPVAGYDPGVPAQHFGAMLRDAVVAIRPLSSRPIVAGGLASRDPSYLTNARAAVGGLTVDAIGVHPYEERVPATFPTPTWGAGNMSDLLDRYLTFGLPLWITEIGINEPARQADYLQNVYQLARDRYAQSIPVVFWFCWSDGMVSPFGVVDRNGAQKPAYTRFRSLAPQ
jgi:hypothetical protein